MADPVTCEKCGKTGKRRMGYVAPEGWFFGSFTFDAEGDHIPGDFLIVHACSVECRDGLWTQQAGHRWDAVETRINVASELKRAARVHAGRLRDEAEKLLETCYPTGEDGTTTVHSVFARILNGIAAELEERIEREIEELEVEQIAVPPAAQEPTP